MTAGSTAQRGGGQLCREQQQQLCPRYGDCQHSFTGTTVVVAAASAAQRAAQLCRAQQQLCRRSRDWQGSFTWATSVYGPVWPEQRPMQLFRAEQRPMQLFRTEQQQCKRSGDVVIFFVRAEGGVKAVLWPTVLARLRCVFGQPNELRFVAPVCSCATAGSLQGAGSLHPPKFHGSCGDRRGLCLCCLRTCAASQSLLGFACCLGLGHIAVVASCVGNVQVPEVPCCFAQGT
jgi:hypothetical protein